MTLLLLALILMHALNVIFNDVNLLTMFYSLFLILILLKMHRKVCNFTVKDQKVLEKSY